MGAKSASSSANLLEQALAQRLRAALLPGDAPFRPRGWLPRLPSCAVQPASVIRAKPQSRSRLFLAAPRSASCGSA